MKGSSLYAHMESEDKYRIQNDVADCTDQDGDQGNGGKSLGSNESIHAKGQLYEQCSECINLHVSGCIADGVGTCTKGQKSDSLNRSRIAVKMQEMMICSVKQLPKIFSADV